jgi:hypothetical protein
MLESKSPTKCFVDVVMYLHSSIESSSTGVDETSDHGVDDERNYLGGRKREKKERERESGVVGK